MSPWRMRYNQSELKNYLFPKSTMHIFSYCCKTIYGRWYQCVLLRHRSVAKEFGTGVLSSCGPSPFLPLSGLHTFPICWLLLSSNFFTAPQLSYLWAPNILFALRPPIGVRSYSAFHFHVQVGKAWAALANIFRTWKSPGHWVQRFGGFNSGLASSLPCDCGEKTSFSRWDSPHQSSEEGLA